MYSENERAGAAIRLPRYTQQRLALSGRGLGSRASTDHSLIDPRWGFTDCYLVRLRSPHGQLKNRFHARTCTSKAYQLTTAMRYVNANMLAK